MPGMGNLRPIEDNVPWATSGPVPAYFISLLKSRIEQVPSQFLFDAGLTREEISKITSGAPITWEEYSTLTTKIWKAETAFNSALWSSGKDTSYLGIRWPLLEDKPPNGFGIPPWMIWMFGALIFLIIIVILLRRT